MALLMEKGAEPQTESELADLDAISALKESAALELKVISLYLLLIYNHNMFTSIILNLVSYTPSMLTR